MDSRRVDVDKTAVFRLNSKSMKWQVMVKWESFVLLGNLYRVACRLQSSAIHNCPNVPYVWIPMAKADHELQTHPIVLVQKVSQHLADQGVFVINDPASFSCSQPFSEVFAVIA